MKSLPTVSSQQRQSESMPGLFGTFRPSYDDLAILALLSDVTAVVAASVLSGGIYHWAMFGGPGNLGEHFELGILLAILTVLLMQLKGLYTLDSVLSLRSHVMSILWIWSGVVFFLLGTSFTFKTSEALSRGSVLSFVVIAPLLLLAQRSWLSKAILGILRKGWVKRRTVLLFVTDPQAAHPHSDIQRPYEVIETYVLPQDPESVRAVFDRMATYSGGFSAGSEVHLAVEWDKWTHTKRILDELRSLPVPVRLIADANAREILTYPQQTLCGTTSFELQRAPLTSGEYFAKRLFDLAASALGLLLMSPFLLAIALAIRIDSPGPVLFRQRRGGFNGKAFQILKFRTMHVMEDGDAITQASRNDDRVTRVGRYLRRWSIDEFPQLLNVLCGQMSLVGPRPHALAHDTQYSELISNYPFRHYVKPGLTGWAQVNGFRGETPDVSMMKERVTLDLWYARNWSFWLDLRILFLTTFAICRSPNAY
ncbi:MAG TPA: undecaprenyl-phosphate glucose phosphotransferase [Pseudolabrys sp.]|nr:undecaprenyl-phosphate glucose phosphotransferase [Pseudolabrys sp.]